MAAWLCYLVLVAPVSGAAHSGGETLADRYTYLPCLAWALLVGGAFPLLKDRLGAAARAGAALLAGVALASFGGRR